ADTSVGPLLCELREGASTGLRGQVAVRMEFLQIVDAPQPTGAELPQNHVAATVISAMFLGEYREVDLTAGDVKLVLRTPATTVLEPGQQVVVRFDPAGCRFITE
ncbi:MAG TPA: TOBE domain-containing protein, partial [Trueperaceae bacterium]|nr:TOBE domain-containing protein [Trueperaceae bacterium]